jgi:phosphotriesterase-related protein
VSAIQTVAGAIAVSDLGFTLVHEHLLVRDDAIQSQFPHLYDQDHLFERVVEQFRGLRERGVRSVCDPTVMGLGRDVRFMRRVSDATGVNIVAATGVYTLSRLPSLFADRPADFLAGAMVHDIEVGIQRTQIRAAFLKCATDERGVTPDIDKVLRATARAHLQTGVPIMTHSLPRNESGLRQQDVFEDEGVDLGRVLIGHCGDTTDLASLERVVERGSFIGMDRYGLDDVLPAEERNQTVAAMCRLGYADRLLLSQDAVGLSDRVYPPELQAARRNWNFFFVIDHVIPRLLELGVGQDAIDAMTKTNVQRWFGGGGRLVTAAT